MKKTTKKKSLSNHDRNRLRSLYVTLGAYSHCKVVKKNIQRQIDEIKGKS